MSRRAAAVFYVRYLGLIINELCQQYHAEIQDTDILK